jgi:hypothetical protein
MRNTTCEPSSVTAADSVGPGIGPEISGDFPQVLAALAARAELCG